MKCDLPGACIYCMAESRKKRLKNNIWSIQAQISRFLIYLFGYLEMMGRRNESQEKLCNNVRVNEIFVRYCDNIIGQLLTM